MIRSNKNKRESEKRQRQRYRELKRRHKNTVAMNAEAKAASQVLCERQKTKAAMWNAVEQAAKFGSRVFAFLTMAD